MNTQSKNDGTGDAVGKWLKANLGSQWLAVGLFFPLLFLLLQQCAATQTAKDDRQQNLKIERITEAQASGKELDVALAAYFDAIALLSLSERGIAMPGNFDPVTVDEGRDAVVRSRQQARVALAEHASDIQALRGAIDLDASNEYLVSLSDIQSVVEDPQNAEMAPTNIATFSRLLTTRNRLVDEALATSDL